MAIALRIRAMRDRLQAGWDALNRPRKWGVGAVVVSFVIWLVGKGTEWAYQHGFDGLLYWAPIVWNWPLKTVGWIALVLVVLLVLDSWWVTRPGWGELPIPQTAPVIVLSSDEKD